MKLSIETDIARTMQRHELAEKARIDQIVGSMVFSGDKRAKGVFKRVLKELEE